MTDGPGGLDGGGSTRDDAAPASRRVLVVEDDPHFGRQLRDYLDYRGWQATVVADGAAATRAFAEIGSDLVLCDVMLPGIDGFDVVRTIRQLPGGEEVPVVVMSAAWGQYQGFEESLRAIGALEFHRKPVSVVDLGRRLEAIVELDQAEDDARVTRSGQWLSARVGTHRLVATDLTPSGDYDSRSLVELLAALFRRRQSGCLQLTCPSRTRELWLVDGYLAGASSDAPRESTVSALATEGLLAPGTIPSLIARARFEGNSLRDALLRHGVIAESDLLRAERLRLHRVVAATVQGPPGEYVFRRGLQPEERGRGFTIHPLPMLWGAIRELPLRRLGGGLVRRARELLVRGPEHDRLIGELPLPADLEWLGSALTEGLTVGDVIERADRTEVAARAICLMLAFRIAQTVSPKRPDRGGDEPPGTGGRATLTLQSDPGGDNLNEPERTLLRDYLTLAAADLYTLLGVERDAGDEEIQRGWRARVVAWRAHALDTSTAARVRTRARELLARVARARDVLTSPARRAAYDAELAREARSEDGPQGTDLRLRAARAAIDEGEWDEAVELLRRVLETMPRSPEVNCLLGWSILRYRAALGPEAAEEALALLRRASMLAPDNPAIRSRLAAALEEVADAGPDGADG